MALRCFLCKKILQEDNGNVRHAWITDEGNNYCVYCHTEKRDNETTVIKGV